MSKRWNVWNKNLNLFIVVLFPLRNLLKKILHLFRISAPLLIQFNQNYKIKLVCIASSYGIGDILYVLPKNEEIPNAYIYRMLNLAKQKYLQIDKWKH